MPEYLTDEWLAAFDAALGAASGLRALAPISIEQQVGGVRYRVWIDAAGGHARRTQSNDSPADLRIVTDYPTAVAIATGVQNAQIALATGRLRLGGDIDTLTRHADAVTALDDIAAALRQDTTYGDLSDASP
jgi:hypothetical protein